MSRTCERCHSKFTGKFKYCVKCRKLVRAELQAEGYLETGGFGHKGMMRTAEQKEDIQETRHGADRF